MNSRFTNDTPFMARLMGSACFISVDAGGNVTGDTPPMTITAGGDVNAVAKPAEVDSKDAPRDPALPPETDEEKAARLAAARANETTEQKTAREAAEAAAADEAAKAAAKTTEEKAAELAAANEAKDKAWTDRDKTKDVNVTAEQETQIKGMAATPEQETLLREFTLETNTTNELSPASRAKAAAAWGVKPEMVDAYVASVLAQNATSKGNATVYDDTGDDMTKWSPELKGQFDARMKALNNVAGGEQNFQDFTAWANAGGLTAEEKQAFSDAIQASPIVGATVAKGYIDRWKAEGNGGGPEDLTRGNAGGLKTPVGKVTGFATRSEQNDAINDPKYAKDPAYRAQVDARIVVSNFSAQGVEKSFFAGSGGMMGAQS